MDKKDEMFVLCEIRHYITCIFDSIEALRQKPSKETKEYLEGFIEYCKNKLRIYAEEYAKITQLDILREFFKE